MDSLSYYHKDGKSISNGNRSKKSQQLGMDYGTASNRLRKNVLLHLLRRLGEDACFKCGKQIETAEELSIEHKVPWLDESSDLFWDMDNISFSHLSCNRPRSEKRQSSQPRRVEIPDGQGWCSRCQKFYPASMFHKNKSAVSGLGRKCKACQSETDRIYKRRVQL